MVVVSLRSVSVSVFVVVNSGKGVMSRQTFLFLCVASLFVSVRSLKMFVIGEVEGDEVRIRGGDSKTLPVFCDDVESAVC